MRLFTICFVIFSAIYLSITSFLFLSLAFHSHASLHFLYPDASTVSRVEIAESQHRNSDTRWFTRVFHNKLFGYVQDYADGVYRSADIAFLFTLTPQSSMYDNQGPIQMLFPWELPLCIVAAIVIIKNYKKYTWLFLYLALCILVAAFFTPPLSQIKLFPEVIGIRLFIVVGLYEASIVCIKKYFLH